MRTNFQRVHCGGVELEATSTRLEAELAGIEDEGLRTALAHFSALKDAMMGVADIEARLKALAAAVAEDQGEPPDET